MCGEVSKIMDVIAFSICSLCLSVCVVGGKERDVGFCLFMGYSRGLSLQWGLSGCKAFFCKRLLPSICIDSKSNSHSIILLSRTLMAIFKLRKPEVKFL
ncbi:hypothetical protein RvY_01579 [Ramazzottius varieornatus]|uniref:Secreted protein n=1 Tax=Ramazzottius varieornatus TaxID=947166 RepID=A0A1D1UKP2_RAMVA|nr:hypothetical protein RvY_01579 [Ramazzottius varieornatus]